MPESFVIPASFAQQRLWVLDQLEPGTDAYNLAMVIRLTGSLKIDTLDACINEIIRRHEVLRTSFTSGDGEAQQVIIPNLSIPVPVADLSQVPIDHRERLALSLVNAQSRRPFDLQSLPLICTLLAREEAGRHVLLILMHHIVSDGWSISEIIPREIGMLYEAFSEGGPSPLEELPIQYADYALWQAEWLQGSVLEERLSYWRKQLQGTPPTLQMPRDRHESLASARSRSQVTATLPAELGDALRQLTRRSGATLFMTLLAAFKLLLYRYTGQADICVGTPIAGREHTATEKLIGFFVNTLALRTGLSGVSTFRQLLDRVRAVSLGAYGHQDLPFEKLIEEIHPDRRLNRQPFFQVFFNMLNFERHHLEVPGLLLEALPVAENTFKFDITLYAVELGERLELILHYNPDMFTTARMSELLRQYQGLLDQIVLDPDGGIEEYSLATDYARSVLPDPVKPLSNEWSQSIPARFSEVVHRFPRSVALLSRNRSLSYEELERNSNRLAHYILASGLPPCSVIAVYAERSAELVCALLAILKAGMAFVILDPAYPPTRLTRCLEIAGPRGWIRTTASPPPEPLNTYVQTCGLDFTFTMPDIDDLNQMEYSPNAPEIEIDPDDLAYVAFTSGSTGQPKAVLGAHRPLPHFLEWHAHTFGLSNTERFALLSGLSHDPVLRDIFTPLWLGAVLCIPESDWVTSPDRLFNWLRENEITVLHLTPALAAMLAQEEQPRNGGKRRTLSSVRYAFFGGDVLSARLVKQFKGLAPSAKIFNFYGATETPQGIAYCQAPDHLDEFEPASLADWKIPVGVGIKDAQLLLLNRGLRLAGIGELAEIHVRTPYLSTGYKDDTGLTAERFLPNPFRNVPEDLIYKTGDLGRYLPDGRVEIIGRCDEQVKILGFRVELKEIEAALLQHPLVKDVIVTINEESGSDKRIVAYVVSGDDTAPGADELTSHLKLILPNYMLPSAYVGLKALPLTPNGKLDRKSLPKLPPRTPILETRHLTPVEEILTQVWTHVLGLERVCVTENFFEIGGHSLLATRVVSRIRDVFQVDIPLRELFETPTISALSKRIERELGGGERKKTARLIPVNRDRRLPVSFAQQQLWFLDKLAPGSAAYNISFAVRLSGPLDSVCVQAALTEITRRHEPLRTCFPDSYGSPTQKILPPGLFQLNHIDIEGVQSGGLGMDIAGQGSAEAARPFDLADGPLVRASLLRLGEGEHILLATMHHIISDGWSIGIMVREFTYLYQAYRDGNESPLPELGIQYADFAVWQVERLEGELFEQEIAYWQVQLAGAPFVLRLHSDRPRPSVWSGLGGKVSFMLSADQSARIRQLARAQNATAFTVLFTIYSAMLYHYSGQKDILIGTDFANRNGVETEGQVGYFANILPLRSNMTEDPSVRQAVTNHTETVLQAYAHQELPFSRLVDALNPERDTTINPLFQVSFAYQNFERADYSLPDTTLSFLEIDGGTSRFDLTLAMGDGDRGIGGAFVYNADLFDGSTVARMSAHFSHLAEAMLTNSGCRVSRLSMLSGAELAQVVHQWNDTQLGPEANGLVHELFEQRVLMHPDAIALVAEDVSLSYAELNMRSNQIAHLLLSRGVSPELQVGLYLERSAELISSMVGVLKAGAAYLPLDPDYPIDRISFMLRDSSAPVVVSTERLLERLPSLPGQVLTLDGEAGVLGYQGHSNPRRLATDANLAYVIYTSGSTGRPKGVMIAHSSLKNLALEQIRSFQIDTTSRVLQFAASSFDASVSEIFTALLAGACLIIGRSSGLMPGGGLQSRLEEEEVTVATFPPTVLSILNRQPLFLKTVVSAGEACTIEVASKWNGARMFLNAYGPTEATVCSTISECRHTTTKPSIGSPIANSQVYVLDSQLQPRAIGLPGQIHIGGTGLARGYLNAPDVTAVKFIPSAFSDREGERLYVSGDIARWRPTGCLDFLGRVDSQIKLRGFRIELGEIEAVLASHPAIADTVVEIKGANRQDPRLIAYVVYRDGFENSTAALREHIRQSLPEFMLPSDFVVLDKLPQSPSGKVDRQRLPEPERSGSLTGGASAKPNTALERAIAQVWEEVLAISEFGLNENFFDLGGDSIKAARVLNKVQQIIGQFVHIAVLFEAPTIDQFCRRLETDFSEALARSGLLCVDPLRDLFGSDQNAEPGSPNAAELTAIERLPRDGSVEFPLSFSQQRLWFLEQIETGNPAYLILTMVQLIGQINIEALSQSFSEVARRHESLRTRFIVSDGKPAQVICPPTRTHLARVNLEGLIDAERQFIVERLDRSESERALDLHAGPAWRSQVMSSKPDDHVLSVVMHHIISDGWSQAILIREIAALYAAFSSGLPSAFSELLIQYADFAFWQRVWLDGPAFGSHLEYWRRRLAGAPPLLNLPLDFSRPSEQSYDGDSQGFELPADLTASVETLARLEGNTPFIVLLAAWNILLSYHCQTNDILTGTDVANRNRAETEELIGFFVNEIVLRTDLSGNPSVSELIRRVRDSVLGAYVNQDVPFDRLVDALNPRRAPNHNPIIQVFFLLQNVPVGDAVLPGIEVAPVRARTFTAKFDLVLNISTLQPRLRGSFIYNTRLFRPDTVARMVEQYITVVRVISSSQDSCLEAIIEYLRRQDAERSAAQERTLQQVAGQKLKASRRRLVS